MPIIDTISKRMEAEANAGANDVLNIWPITIELRNQIIHILINTFDRLPNTNSLHDIWIFLMNAWDEERGVFRHENDYSFSYQKRQLLSDFQNCPERQAADFIDIAARLLDQPYRTELENDARARALLSADRALDTLNIRLRESRMAYRFEPSLGKLVNIGTEFTHEHIVRPMLNLLAQPGFEEALREFRTAYDHVAEAKWKDAVTSAGRAFEATMKAICRAREWTFEENMQARQLVTVCIGGGLLPDWLDSSLNNFVAMLKSGVPHARNNAGAHGASVDAAPVTEELARYAINQAATNILLLLERNGSLGKA